VHAVRPILLRHLSLVFAALLMLANGSLGAVQDWVQLERSLIVEAVELEEERLQEDAESDAVQARYAAHSGVDDGQPEASDLPFAASVHLPFVPAIQWLQQHAHIRSTCPLHIPYPGHQPLHCCWLL
jgi:hypothetical protein